jgi:hypothetical protein
VIRALDGREQANLTLLRVRKPDTGWVIPDRTEPALCSTCGAPIDPHSSRDLEWRAVYEPSRLRDPPDLPAHADERTQLPLDQVVTHDAKLDIRASLDQAIQAARSLGYTPESTVIEDHDW